MASETQSIEAFKTLQRQLWGCDYLTRVLDFDGETVAPLKGADARAEAMGMLAGRHHDLMCSSEAQELVATLHELNQAGKLDPQTADELRVFARDQHEAMAIPGDEAAAWTKLTSKANAVWHQAKLADDWESFEPYLEQIVETLKRHASYLDSTRDPYDVWLDQYERGLDAKTYDAFFDQVRATVVPLVHEIGTKPYEVPSFMSAAVSSQAQIAQAYDLMRTVGLDMDAVGFSEVEHPFSDGFALGDARVTTHIYEDNALSSAYSVIHESGHAVYEQNVNPAYAYTCLAGGTSMAIHESQSRFFENYVGRSRAFMGTLLRIMSAHAPEAYAGVTEDDLYHAVNAAQPGLIRMEADELTYPLHIMIRYDIERALFAGDATVHDIPALWNKLTKEYLGLDVPNNSLGCLQDTHWSGGSLGYFPTYALGSAYGAQYLDAMQREGVDFNAACEAGNLAPITSWLHEHIWQYGRSKDAPELIQIACGVPFDATYYCDYLQKKFSALYNL